MKKLFSYLITLILFFRNKYIYFVIICIKVIKLFTIKYSNEISKLICCRLLKEDKKINKQYLLLFN